MASFLATLARCLVAVVTILVLLMNYSSTEQSGVSIKSSVSIRNVTSETRDKSSNEDKPVASKSIEDMPVASNCFTPRKARSKELLKSNVIPPKPIINLGMPKAGSSTLEQFFDCAGYRASHWETSKHGLIGLCMREAVQNGRPPIASCDSWYREMKNFDPPLDEDDKNVEALLQMDVINSPDDCVFPQISYLDELHAEAPNATFILNFRNIQDWVKSVQHWAPRHLGTMASRFYDCNLPGLPRGKGNSTGELKWWWCQQVHRVRSFVAKHPSHALIELDLYDNDYNAEFMSSLFQTDAKCWGHANANPKLGH